MVVEDTGGDESGHGVAKLLRFGGIGLSGRGGGGTVAFHCGGVAGRRGGHPPQAGAPTLGSRRCGAGWLVCGGSAVVASAAGRRLGAGDSDEQITWSGASPFLLQAPASAPWPERRRRQVAMLVLFPLSLSLSSTQLRLCFSRKNG